MTALTQCDDLIEILSRPDREIDLAFAALLIARDEYPDLEVEAYRGRLDRMGLEARPGIARAMGNPFAAIDALNSYLFGEQGFRGSREDYFDPRNSYLNEVLDRRRGIPITLSVVYMEVAARAGLPLVGVGFPGHFLVRHAAAGREILIDPFHSGEVLLPEDCEKRLAASCGEHVPLEPRFFRTAGNRAILNRMLQNLKHVYMRSGDHARVLRVIDRLMLLGPPDPHHLKDRGEAHAGLCRYDRAVADLQRYLELSPDPDEAESIRSRIKGLRRAAALLN